VRSRLAAWTSEAVAGREGLRAVPEPSLHVTLVFLGATDPAEVPAVWGAVPGAPRSPRFAGGALVALPRRRPRVFALGIEDEGGVAAALQLEIADGLGVSERRPWLPHVTLARVRKGHRATHLATDLPSVEPFAPTAITLLRSHPGSRYEALERVALERQSS